MCAEKMTSHFLTHSPDLGTRLATSRLSAAVTMASCIAMIRLPFRGAGAAEKKRTTDRDNLKMHQESPRCKRAKHHTNGALRRHTALWLFLD